MKGGDLLTEIIQEAREAFPKRFEGKSDREIIREIAAVVRQAEEAAQ